MHYSPNGYPVPEVGDVALAEEKGYLTKAEARATVLELFPAAKRIADAEALIATTKGE